MTNKLKTKSNTTVIDFGVGKMTITIEPHSSITLTEVAECLQNLAMTVPLQQVINALNRIK